jgi:quercetin dioxygenase-like cupin family protein
MIFNDLLADLTFHESAPYAQPLLVDKDARIIRWMLKPGQAIEEHRVPELPLYLLVISGKGVFTDGKGVKKEVGPASLLIFEPGETHSVAALDQELVFVTFLKSVEGMRPDRVGGELGQEIK